MGFLISGSLGYVFLRRVMPDAAFYVVMTAGSKILVILLLVAFLVTGITDIPLADVALFPLCLFLRLLSLKAIRNQRTMCRIRPLLLHPSLRALPHFSKIRADKLAAVFAAPKSSVRFACASVFTTGGAVKSEGIHEARISAHVLTTRSTHLGRSVNSLGINRGRSPCALCSRRSVAPGTNIHAAHYGACSY